MPPRYSYWTILAGGLPTSFRAADRDDLFPTFRRLQERHPDAEMKWFQRGRLWDSPEAARRALENTGVQRGRDWRPGGEHRDPRATFKKNKQHRNQARRQQRFARKHSAVNEKESDGHLPHAGKRVATGFTKRRRPPRQVPKGGRRQR